MPQGRAPCPGRGSVVVRRSLRTYPTADSRRLARLADVAATASMSKSASSARKGKAAEPLVAAICVLATGAELNALTARVGDEGVDRLQAA